MPKFGQMEEEVQILLWRKHEGDRVAKDDVLFEVETDKAVMEVNSFFEGVLLKILVPDGKTVPVMSAVAYIGEPGEKVPEEPPPAGAPALRGAISPRAAMLAKEAGIDVGKITGTGPEGRVTEKDVKAFIEAHKQEAPAPAHPQPLSRIRQIIAQRVTQSYTTTPHFFTTVSVDVTDLEELRGRWKKEGRSYSLNDFVLKAAAEALMEHPDVNSRTEAGGIVRHPEVHLGIAVTIEQGLVVAVIREANHLSVDEIHRRASELTEKARAGKLTPDDMQGSTFTVSNMGMFDIENFTAIINAGEGAILAVSSALRKPAVVGDAIAIRRLMKMTLSADHRIIDGALAARFLHSIKEKLENPAG